MRVGEPALILLLLCFLCVSVCVRWSAQLGVLHSLPRSQLRAVLSVGECAVRRDSRTWPLLVSSLASLCAGVQPGRDQHGESACNVGAFRLLALWLTCSCPAFVAQLGCSTVLSAEPRASEPSAQRTASK